MQTAANPRPTETASTSSTFFHDGYNDAAAGLPASPPDHPATWVYAIEYLAGYKSFSRS